MKLGVVALAGIPLVYAKSLYQSVLVGAVWTFSRAPQLMRIAYGACPQVVGEKADEKERSSRRRCANIAASRCLCPGFPLSKASIPSALSSIFFVF